MLPKAKIQVVRWMAVAVLLPLRQVCDRAAEEERRSLLMAGSFIN